MTDREAGGDPHELPESATGKHQSDQKQDVVDPVRERQFSIDLPLRRRGADVLDPHPNEVRKASVRLALQLETRLAAGHARHVFHAKDVRPDEELERARQGLVSKEGELPAQRPAILGTARPVPKGDAVPIVHLQRRRCPFTSAPFCDEGSRSRRTLGQPVGGELRNRAIGAQLRDGHAQVELHGDLRPLSIDAHVAQIQRVRLRWTARQEKKNTDEPCGRLSTHRGVSPKERHAPFRGSSSSASWS